MAHYHHDIGPCTGQGRTQKAARQEAEDMAAMMLNGSYEPEVVRYRDWTGLAYRTPHGWQYQIWAESETLPNRCCRHQFFHDERDRCIESMVNHLCQNAWSLNDGPNAPAFVHAKWPEVARGLEGWYAWQGRYAANKIAGMTDQEAHYAATMNAS